MATEYTQFFRCAACGTAIEMTEHLAKGRTKCWCGGGRFIPTIITKWEIFKYLISHPKVLIETILGRIKCLQK